MELENKEEQVRQLRDSFFYKTERYLNSKIKKEKFIYRKSLYPNEIKTEFMLLYNTYGHALFKSIIEAVDYSIERHTLCFENKCGKCGNFYIFETMSSETYIKMLKYSYIESKLTDFDIDNKFICNYCIEEIKDKKEKELEYKTENRQKIKDANTIEFIKLYCTPYADFIKSKTSYQGWDAMCGLYDNSNHDHIISYLKKLKYKDFLNTNYWKKIKEYKKYKSRWNCELCGEESNLHVHHKIYKNHGYEIYREVIYNDLVVLCQGCHHKFHNTLYKEEEHG